jgi:hypothetical protein
MLGVWLKSAENFAHPMKDFVHHETGRMFRIPLWGGGTAL